MNTRWSEFDVNRIDAAARLLTSIRRDAFGQIADTFDADTAVRSIRTELDKDVSSAFMLVDNGELVGYAVATVFADPMWGRSGWLAPGAYALHPDYQSTLPELYARIGEEWVKRDILDHKVFTFAPRGRFGEMWGELGFAKQQTYAVLDRPGMRGATEIPSSKFVVRRAEERDRAEIATFSRVIASYQAAGPCFAPVPDQYLRALDEGFAELLDDNELDVTVVERDGSLYGIAVVRPVTEVELLAPAGCVELPAVAVKPEYRGTGAGTALSRFLFADLAQRGRSCVVTDWRCANPLSSRFWPRMGFAPIAHRLVRRLDPLCSPRS